MPAQGPRLIPAGEGWKEPRKIRSVLVRNATAPRPIESASEERPDGNPRVSRDKGNILRTARNEGETSPQWREQQQDPFENSVESQRGAAFGSARSQQTIASSNSTRSVLVQDPFEEAGGSTSRRGKFASQSQPADDGERDPASQSGEDGTPDDSFREFGNQPTVNGSALERTTEQERLRAERVCQDALDKLSKNIIGSIELGLDVPGSIGIDVPFECALDTVSYQPRAWSDVHYQWKASALCHKPLYFEDVHLERYGHSWGWHLQPLASAAHFFGTLPILPYKMGLETPNECVYSLGYYRPGNCAPYLIEPLGTSPRAVVWQAGAVVGAAAIIP